MAVHNTARSDLLPRRVTARVVDSLRGLSNRHARFLLPALLLACFLSTSFYGLNFGIHWDESQAKMKSVRNSLETGLFLQSSGEDGGHGYNYGGVNYLLTWAALTPEVLVYFHDGNLTREALSKEISWKLYTVPFKVRLRAIYLVLCGLSIAWLFCLDMVLGRSRLEAFLAAAILAGSWEFAYHSRWIAPDAVMAQFALLAFLCLAVAYRRASLRWFYLGAIAVGLTAGTKYPGGLLLPYFMVGAAHAMWQQRRSTADILRHSIGIVGAAGLTFIITTPGAILDPFNFFGELKALREVYANGWYGYTVQPGFSHLLEMLRYFALQIFSHYWTLSIVVAIFCLLGFVSLMLERTVFGLLVVGFVIAYLAYFSLQATMIVRNLLVVVPFLCLAAARGITWVATRQTPRTRWALYSGIGVILAVNLGWEAYAADQIKRREDLAYFLTKFETYVRNDPSNTYLVTAKLANALAAIRAPMPANIVQDQGAPHTKVAFLQTEGPDIYWKSNWPANSWGLYEANFGALEVNLDAYPTFLGNQRIIVVTAENFRKLPLPAEAMRNP